MLYMQRKCSRRGGEDPALEISLEEAEKLDSALQVGDIAQIPVHSKEFGRIMTQNAKNLILQK